MERPFEIEELLAQAGWLRALAASLVTDPARADDLVQDAWVAALRRPPASDGSPRPWLARVVRNLARNVKRGDDRRTAHEVLAHEERPESTPASIAQQAEAQRLLADAVAKLAEPLRAVIVLRYFQGLDSAAIGRELALPPSTVRSRVQKALEELRAELDRKFEGGRAAWVAFLGGRWRASPLAKTATGAASIAGRLAPLVAGALVVVAGAAVWKLSRAREAEDARRSAAISIEQESPAVSPIPLAASRAELAASVASSQRTAVPSESAASVEAEAPEPTSAAEDSAVVYIDGRVADRPVEFEIGLTLDTPSLFVHSDEHGRLRLAGSLSSERELRASGFGPEGIDMGDMFVAPRRAPNGELQVRLLSCPVVTGRVLDADSRRPLAFVLSTLEATHSRGGFSFRFQTDEEGRFDIALVAGDRLRAQLLFEAPGHGRRLVESPEFVRTESLDLGDIVLEPARSVPFHILDSSLHPIPGAAAKHEDWNTSVGVDQQGAGVLSCVPFDGAQIRFGARRHVDQVLQVRPGDSPRVLLEPTNVLAIHVVSNNGAALPGFRVIVADFERLFVDTHGMWPNVLSEGAYSTSTTSGPGLPLFLVNYQAGSNGELLLRDLKPDLSFSVEVRDLSGHTLAARTCSLGTREWQELEIPIGP